MALVRTIICLVYGVCIDKEDLQNWSASCANSNKPLILHSYRDLCKHFGIWCIYHGMLTFLQVRHPPRESDLQNFNVRSSLCRILLPPHRTPRYVIFKDKEHQEPSLQVIFQREAPELSSALDLKKLTVEKLLHTAFSNRLFKLSRIPDPPFYGAGVSQPA